MTIQIPNPGTGNGATGDNEFVMWTKVKDNFSNQDHAASRLVGTSAGQIPLVENTYHTYNDAGYTAMPSDLHDFYASGTSGKSSELINSATVNKPFNDTQTIEYQHKRDFGVIHAYGSRRNTIWVKTYASRAGGWSAWGYYYTSANTTVDSNGFIKASSPIVKVFANKAELNNDAEGQGVTFTRNDIGDYTITTQSGLSTDGWYLELPKDLNGNPKIAVTLSETDGVISLKCYKRIFSMTTFTFEPDLDEPLDIPDGRWIDLRLNDLPNNDPVPDEV